MKTRRVSSAAERIRLAMAPDPAEWFFTGDVVDHGEYGSAECTCGHPVRYQFLIARADGKRLPIGSHCIRESVPFLIAAGAQGLARELELAARRVDREQSAARRVAAARRELPELRRDFRLLREWCWACRREWTKRYGRDWWKPEILHRPPKLPAAAGGDDESAKSIRRRYTSDWFAAVACALEGDLPLPPLPRNRRLWKQLGRRMRSALGDPSHRHHALACRTRAAYYARRERQVASRGR